MTFTITKDTVVWITGASSGLGEALAEAFITRGARVAVTARRGDLLAALATRLTSRGPGVARAYPGTVTDGAALRQIAQQIEAEMGPITAVIANAGINEYTNPLQFATDEYLSIMDTNYGGMLRTFDAVLPEMIQRSAGTLVGVASLAAYRGLPTSAAYGASKAAMIHFMESIRFHLERKGIGVVIVNPGFVQTPMTDTNTFPMPSLVTASYAAEDVLRQLTSGRTMIAFPWVFSRLMAISRVIPYVIYAWLVRRLWSRMKHGNE